MHFFFAGEAQYSEARHMELVRFLLPIMLSFVLIFMLTNDRKYQYIFKFPKNKSVRKRLKLV